MSKRYEALKKYLKNKRFSSYSNLNYSFEYKIKGIRKDSFNYYHVNVEVYNFKTKLNIRITKNCDRSSKLWFNSEIRAIVYEEMKSLFDIFGYGSNFGRVDKIYWKT